MPKGEVPKPPVMKIKPITSMGKLSMQFTQDMEYPSELQKKFKADKKVWDKIYDILMNPDADQKSKEETRRLRVG